MQIRASQAFLIIHQLLSLAFKLILCIFVIIILSLNMDNGINSKSQSKRNSTIAMAIVAIIIAIIAFFIWRSHTNPLIQPTTFEQPTDSLNDSTLNIDSLQLDSTLVDSIDIDSIDSLDIDSLKADSLSIDSINKLAQNGKGSIFDTSKKEMKDRLLAIEKLITDAITNYDKGKTSAKDAKAMCDSVANEVESILKNKNSNEFKYQIKSINRKTNELLNSLGYIIEDNNKDNN